ncbi:PAS domain-containing sensor histidine kinase [Mangrovivirga sp. M17]|uniref:histidine kinase n=1 Tax=Mangrovivirga halotolerans TaxID=2993936 RepID=A0ABT3RSJ4_9BACT|nr:PAS domain-containing sensor histidine kinase [Mangrovivirga halotolerans]MCX2744217.1 PAS domain-containing sensor histidine kinase [Mangrovivirga halotolerans]
MWIYSIKTLQFLDVNEAALSKYRYTRKEFLNLSLLDIIKEADKSGAYRNYFGLNQPNQNDKKTWTHYSSDKDELIVEKRSYKVKFKNKDAILEIIIDVTSRLEANKKLTASINELNDFVYRASHDIRGPLARIIGLSNIMKKDEGKAKKFSELIENTATVLDHNLKRLLSLNNIKNIDPMPSKIDVRDLIKTICSVERIQHQGTGINLIYDFQRNLVVYTDEQLLRIILENIIENAFKYSKNNEDSFILITAYKKDHDYYIHVYDNGIGIEEKIRSKIFDYYFRGTSKSEGPGIGLSISKQAAKKINASIFYDKIKLSNDIVTEFKIKIPPLSLSNPDQMPNFKIINTLPAYYYYS